MLLLFFCFVRLIIKLFFIFAVRFDYADPFHSCSQEFLSRVSEMHRVQMDTIEWERKKKLTKKKTKVAVTNSNNNNSSNANND